MAFIPKTLLFFATRGPKLLTFFVLHVVKRYLLDLCFSVLFTGNLKTILHDFTRVYWANHIDFDIVFVWTTKRAECGWLSYTSTWDPKVVVKVASHLHLWCHSSTLMHKMKRKLSVGILLCWSVLHKCWTLKQYNFPRWCNFHVGTRGWGLALSSSKPQDVLLGVGFRTEPEM